MELFLSRKQLVPPPTKRCGKYWMSYLHLSSAYSFSGPIFEFPREAKHSFSKFGYFGSSFSIIILYFKIILSLPLSRVGNTDAEGRMVMVDVLCKVRDRFLEFIFLEPDLLFAWIRFSRIQIRIKGTVWIWICN